MRFSASTGSVTSRTVPTAQVQRFRAVACLRRADFWSNANRATSEPPHIHVSSGQGLATFWLSPVSYRDSRGYTQREIALIRRLVVVHQDALLRHWHDFFGE